MEPGKSEYKPYDLDACYVLDNLNALISSAKVFAKNI